MRRLYKLLSWDYETDEGRATDGTIYDGEPITFTARGCDLDPEYKGFLNIGEVFSAEESPNHLLFDIVIERGARAPVRPTPYREPALTADAVENIVESSRTVKEQMKQFYADVNECAPMTPGQITAEIAVLKHRIKRLEDAIESRVDDHR